MKTDLFVKCINLFKSKLYILSDEENELFEYDMANKKLTYLGVISKNDSYFCTSCIVEDKIYYFSYFGTEICIYDISNNLIDYLNIEMEKYGKKFGCCSSCFCCDKSIYIFGGGNALPLIEFDTENRTVIDRSDWLKQCDQSNTDTVKNIAYTNPCVIDGTIWAPTNIDGTILEYNIETSEYHFYRVTDMNIKFLTVNKNGNDLLLSGNNDSVIKWNPRKNKIIAKYVLNGNCRIKYRMINNISEGMFYTGFEHNGYIMYMPLRANSVCKFKLGDTETIIEELLPMGDDEYCFWAYDLDKYGILFQIGDSKNTYRHTYIYDDEIREISFLAGKIDYSKNTVNQIMNGNITIRERYQGMFNWFIEELIK